MAMEWNNIKTLEPQSFICGHCGSDIASNQGFNTGTSGVNKGLIYICHKCTCPNFFHSDGSQTPGSIFGDSVKEITDSLVDALYNEARKCMSVSSFTAAVLCCRKLLMHIAVSKGAEEGNSFVYYVEYLRDNNYVPPDAKGWVDHIRKKGNEANHEIIVMEKDDAEELISFVGMLLKIIYEFPARVSKKSQP